MRVLVGCEESQEVCKAFRAKGHLAFSCDLQDCSGGHPEWHIKHDVLDVINESTWDLMVCHPPCTYLTTAGNRWFNIKKYGDKARRRYQLRSKALDFCLQLYNSKVKKVALENPQGFLGTMFRKPDQIINPFDFGTPERKRTCLWLKNLPLLYPTKVVTPKHYGYGKNNKPRYWYALTSKKDRAKIRSKTFPCIAKAMADQWG